MRRLAILLLLTLSLGNENREQAQINFSLDISKDYFALPYPNDLHRRRDGTVDRSNYPVPSNNPLALNYRKIADHRDGFGVTECAFFRTTSPLTDVRFPELEESVTDDSPIQLINIDRDSPDFKKRTPIYSYFHSLGDKVLKNLLAVCPYPGFVLRENTKYAVLVKKSLSSNMDTNPIFAQLLKGEKNPALSEEAFKVYLPLLDYISSEGIPPDDVAGATVYTTGEPTRNLRDIMNFIEELPPAKLSAPPTLYRNHTAFYALKSSYIAPQLQTGKASQLAVGGKILFDKDGKPILQHEEKIPVVITIPKGKMPKAGFPLVIYLHGGGNTTDEFLDHIIKSKKDQFTAGEGPARTFAERGIAGVTMAIVKNPERYGKLGAHNRFSELPFYNFFRGDVLVANHWQACADAAVLLRLMRELRIDPRLCPDTETSASEDGMIKFDPRFFFSMGFSMGGTILGIWSGVEPGIRATIPSGASGHWGLLIRNFTWGENMPWFYSWLTGGNKSDPMDIRWPALNLVQTALEPADTIVYAPHVYKRPFPYHPAKHVYLAVGLNDFYTKTITQNAIITALELPLAGKAREPTILINLNLKGWHKPFNFPVTLNVVSDNGERVTASALQYQPDTWTNEGHNVNYNLTETKHQYGCFLRTFIDTGKPVIPPPAPERSPCVYP